MEGFHHGFVLRQMCDDAQLDLGIINRQQFGAGRGNKTLSDPSAQFGARGDVLQVRVLRSDAPCYGSGLVERCVYASGFRVHLHGQRVNVG